MTRTYGLSLSAIPKSSQGVFINKNAGETFEIDMLLESELEGENTVSLSMNNAFPSGWSYDFKENGATVNDVVIDYQESISLVLLLTVALRFFDNDLWETVWFAAFLLYMSYFVLIPALIFQGNFEE